MSDAQTTTSSTHDEQLKAAGAMPGSRNWSSALSRVPQPYREAALAYAQRVARQHRSAQTQDPDRDELEQSMLAGGRALSLITYTAFLPFHLIGPNEQERVRALLSEQGPTAVMQHLQAQWEASQTILLIGDEPSAEVIDQAIKAMGQEKPIRCLIAGPGNLMESAIRQWAAQEDIKWQANFIRTLDGSGGQTWQLQSGDQLDRHIAQLFDVHSPDRVALLEPVRLPATQITIEQAAHRHIPMSSFQPKRVAIRP